MGTIWRLHRAMTQTCRPRKRFEIVRNMEQGLGLGTHCCIASHLELELQKGKEALMVRLVRRFSKGNLVWCVGHFRFNGVCWNGDYGY